MRTADVILYASYASLLPGATYEEVTKALEEGQRAADRYHELCARERIIRAAADYRLTELLKR